MKSRWIQVIGMHFGLQRTGDTGFDALFNLPDKSVSKQYLDLLWERCQRPMGDIERIDALGVVALYYIMCNADLSAKISAVFALFDFNRNNEISKDELTILFMSVCYALLGFMEKIPPEQEKLRAFETRCEKLAIDGFAFKAMNKEDEDGNVDDVISRQEFADFITKELDIDQDGTTTIDELLSFFSDAAGGGGGAAADADAEAAPAAAATEEEKQIDETAEAWRRWPWKQTPTMTAP